jgi:hypothetical protein
MHDNEFTYLRSDLPYDFAIFDDIVYKISNTGIKLPVIPSSLRGEILSYFHELPHSGHGGFRKTFSRISRRVFWARKREDVFAFIRSCRTFQVCKNPSTEHQGNLQSNNVYGPWDMLALDLIGLLPRSKNGKTMLLVVVDHFKKWVELFALIDVKADKICEILEAEIFSRWGSMKSIISDNATNFRGNVFAKMNKSWGISHNSYLQHRTIHNAISRSDLTATSKMSLFHTFTQTTRSGMSTFPPLLLHSEPQFATPQVLVLVFSI